MELSQLSDRAMQIRDCFAAHEQARTGRIWTREEIMQGFVGDVGDLMKTRDGPGWRARSLTPTASSPMN